MPHPLIVTLEGPVDVAATLLRPVLFGGDPTTRREGGATWCAFHTADGPAAVGYRPRSEREVEVEAHGPGAERALAGAADALGARDRPDTFAPTHPLLAPLAKRFSGVRFGRTGRVLERLVPTILAQKVTGKSAGRSYAELVRRASERAPGPIASLWLPPSVERLRELAYYDLHPLGVEQKRARIVFEVVRRASAIERLVDAEPDAAWRGLTSVPGIGPWTAAHVLAAARGDADLVAVGDYHLPNLVVHALTGRDRGTDEEMLALLEPFRPHRGRALALLMAAGISAPRFGPRMPIRDIRGE